MKISILPQFIDDLKSLDNIKTLGRVLEKLFDNKFVFKQNRDDHRYDGVADAWIRDISKGITAYRCIYIQKDDKIYLYRAGTKKIEDNLQEPSLDEILALEDFQATVRAHVKELKDLGKLLRSPKPTELLNEILSYKHVFLREILIISPAVSKEIFTDTNYFGKFINQAIEEGTGVILITKPPKSQEDIVFFDGLDIKGLVVMYHERLHAKMWFLDVDYNKLSPYQIEEGYQSVAILGSANMTMLGMAIDTSIENDVELCYRLPVSKNDEFYEYCNTIYENGTEHSKYKQQKRWR